MTRPDLRVALDWFCGCGDPYAAAGRLRDLLRLHPLYEHQTEIYELLPDSGIRYLTLYMLDHHGFTEHGSVIDGGWLTDRGKAVLEALDRELDLGPDDEGDYFTELFDAPYCVHGLAPGDEGYAEHDCMAAD